MSRRTRTATKHGLSYLALACYMVFLGFPLLWLLSTALKTPRELATLTPHIVPRVFDWANFPDAIQAEGLLRAAGNSALVAVSSTILVTVVALPAGYALARYHTRIRGVALGWILVSQVFPFILIVIPLFLLLLRIGLNDTLIGLILVYLVWSLPFALWLLRSYAAGVPRDLEEAAAIDGAGRLRTLTTVVLPLLRPGIVATAMFTFVAAWNEFFFALVLLQKPSLHTLPLALAQFLGQEGQVRLGELAAGSLLATIPSLVFFSFLQKRLTSGLLAGALKG